MNIQKQTTPCENPFFAALFLLGFLEFGAAAIFILCIDPDPKNAVLLGYSLPRIALFLLTIFLSLGLLALSRLVWRGQLTERFDELVQEKSAGWVSLFMAILALLILVMPPAWLGPFDDYYQRIQPLIFVLCAYPVQLSLNWLFRKGWQLDEQTLLYFLIFSIIIAIFWTAVLLSGYGITPEKEYATGIHWSNIAGTPITMFQWLFALLVMLGGVPIATPLLKFKRIHPKWIDIGIALSLYAVTVLVWAGTPLKESTFASKPEWPHYQPFPLSDAAVHDLGALSILQGQGINFGAYTDKPIYMSFLAFLHLISGYNYNLLTLLHICFLALIAPTLYYFGKSFHSRPAGILIALVILLRQRNAILLTNVLYYNAAPNLLMSEVPTLLGLIILTGFWFVWMKKPQTWLALAAGGVLGVASLTRLNLVLSLPVIPGFALLMTWHDKKRWVAHSLAYLLGFSLLITPWLVTGVNSGGQSYFLLKFYDVIKVRYNTVALPTKPSDPVELGQSVQPIEPGQPAEPNRPTQTPPETAIEKFPGFVINNFMHNIVESFLILPDSLSPSQQNLSNLDQRFYWKPETFEQDRIPYLVLNCFLVAIGLAWSWRCWKWPGMVPILGFLVYSLSLALGRTSGSRYLIPIDWIFFFYYILGVLTLLGKFLPAFFLSMFRTDAEATAELSPTGRSQPLIFWVTLATLVALATVIPINNNLIRKNASLCQASNLPAIVARQFGPEAVPGMDFRKGIVLYPHVEKKTLTFDLLSCQQITSVKMALPFIAVNSGDVVIVGWPTKKPLPDPLMISLITRTK